MSMNYSYDHKNQYNSFHPEEKDAFACNNEWLPLSALSSSITKHHSHTGTSLNFPTIVQGRQDRYLPYPYSLRYASVRSKVKREKGNDGNFRVFSQLPHSGS